MPGRTASLGLSASRERSEQSLLAAAGSPKSLSPACLLSQAHPQSHSLLWRGGGPCWGLAGAAQAEKQWGHRGKGTQILPPPLPPFASLGFWASVRQADWCLQSSRAGQRPSPLQADGWNGSRSRAHTLTKQTGFVVTRHSDGLLWFPLLECPLRGAAQCWLGRVPAFPSWAPMKSPHIHHGDPRSLQP